MAAQAEASGEGAAAIAPGARVLVHGLTSAAGCKLNGRVGKISEWVPDKGRYTVELFTARKLVDLKSQSLGVKPANLVALHASSGRLATPGPGGCRIGYMGHTVRGCIEPCFDLQINNSVKSANQPLSIGSGLGGEGYSRDDDAVWANGRDVFQYEISALRESVWEEYRGAAVRTWRGDLDEHAAFDNCGVYGEAGYKPSTVSLAEDNGGVIRLAGPASLYRASVRGVLEAGLARHFSHNYILYGSQNTVQN
jgi:hypothetical protein